MKNLFFSKDKYKNPRPDFDKPSRAHIKESLYREKRSSYDNVIGIDEDTSTSPTSSKGKLPKGAQKGKKQRLTRREVFKRSLFSPIVCMYALIVASLFLTALGVVMVFSSATVTQISAGLSPFKPLITQGIFALIGISVAIGAIFINMKFYKKWAYVFLICAWCLQLLTLTPLGRGAGGNTAWVGFGPLQFQPVEILKLAICLELPVLIIKSADKCARKKYPWYFTAYWLPFVVLAVAVATVLAGKDLGSALILSAIGLVLIFIGGCEWRVFFPLLAIVIVLILLIFVGGSANRMDRIRAMLGGCSPGKGDASGACYQAIHGTYAIASGGWTGLGLGASREKWNYLPEARNDFIYAVIGEELGFWGAFLVILAFAVITWSLVVIAYKMQDRRLRYQRLVLMGIAVWIPLQGFVNILVVLELAPVVGLALPFISAGGTSLVACLAAIGVAVRMSMDLPQVQQNLPQWARRILRKSLASAPTSKVHSRKKKEDQQPDKITIQVSVEEDKNSAIKR